MRDNDTVRRPRTWWIVASAGSLVVVAASAAWACVPQPRLVVVAPKASGPPGSRVSVEGIGFDASPARVEIRWNTADGPTLGTADQADFAVPVTIPDAAPGLYGILVMSRGADGVLGNTGRAAFQVTDEPRPPPGPPATSTPQPTFAAAPAASTSSAPGALWLGTVAVVALLLGLTLGRRFTPARADTPDAVNAGEPAGPDDG
jgi:hypothetical protein